MSQPDGNLLTRLRDSVNATLSSLGPFEGPVALLDFPNHPNVGDSAIWLGETSWLRSVGLRPYVVCDLATCDHGAVRERLRKVRTIFLHGGGNLGDIWITHQLFRERILAEFPDRRVIQFSQTIRFDSPEVLRSATRAFNRHPHFTLLARDAGSLAFAEREFDCDVRLCPDMAFALAPIRRPKPATDVFVLRRTDKESRFSVDLPVGVEVGDWLREAPSLAIELERRTRYTTRLTFLRPRLYDSLAADRLRRGCTLLGRGRVVVTDRLHAHILCLLMGIPHVVLDSGYGKLSAFWETWTAESTMAQFEHDFSRALARAKQLVSPAASGPIQ